MATACLGKFGQNVPLLVRNYRFLSQINVVKVNPKSNASRRVRTTGMVVAATVASYVTYSLATESALSITVLAKGKDETSKLEEKLPIHSHREMRFLNFASVQYDGNIYMTPQDFLDSVCDDKPRPRTSRKHLRQSDVEKFLKSTPAKNKGSDTFFRTLNDKGLISYTEYLFLLSVLTKPLSGFRIAFNMFDTDGDQRVDKKEFLVLMHLFKNQVLVKKDVLETDSVGPRSVRKNIWNLINSQESTEDKATELLNDTTLTVHFFGVKGNDVLKYEDFHKFMDNLQTEVLSREFHKYSQGMPTIKEEDFAKSLLRYTILTKEEHDIYLERLRTNVTPVQGITFNDFKEFCQFLNNIDDFTLAMRFYTYADHPISEADFQRAVKACTGQNLDSHVIHVVFELFDEDRDHKLSHKEFIAVMKERLHRVARVIGEGRWSNFKSCVKNELRNA